MNREPYVERGFFDSLRDKLHLDTLIEKIKMSKDIIIDVGVYLGIGFLSGFILKRYSTYFITTALIFALLTVLVQFDLITIAINWQKVYTVLGIDQVAPDGETLLETIWQWAKSHVSLSVSALVGFLIGLKAA